MSTNNEPIEIIKKLTCGIHPINNTPLPADSVCHTPEVVKSLFHAINALERDAARERRAANQPANSGKPWSKEEDEKLLSAFEQGSSTKLLASSHGRSISAIISRLMKHGKVAEGQWVDGFQVQKPRYDERLK